MKYLIYIVFILAFSSHGHAIKVDDDKLILAVMENFKESIVTKDKGRFLNLFVEPTSTMFGVVSEKSMVARRAGVEEINRKDNKNFVATRFWRSSPEIMINRIIKNNTNSYETFKNIKITTDGNIANVFADYEYFMDNKKQHWGTESWQMIQTLKGWKIAAISYSITFEE